MTTQISVTESARRKPVRGADESAGGRWSREGYASNGHVLAVDPTGCPVSLRSRLFQGGGG